MKKLKNKIKEHPVYIKAGVIALVSVLCTACLYISDNQRSVRTNKDGQPVLKRGEYGEDTVQEMKVLIGEDKEEENINISVTGREYTSTEMNQVFARAGEKLETYILGENESLDEVRYDLDLITEFPDSGISVSWELDRYDVMDIQGNLREEMLTAEGTTVRLTAILSYGEDQEIREFYARIFPPVKSREDRIMVELDQAISQSDEKTKSQEYLVLPDSIDGQEIQWRYGTETRAAALLVLGIGAACMMVVSESQRKKEAEKKSIRQMKLDYPRIINRFNLYIRAGMTIRRAWFCIAQDYENKKKTGEEKGKRKAYEEMVSAMYRMQSGAAEGECYENYGTRCGISAYRKFGMMLSQNLRKGTKGLTEFLGREAEDAFEERKNLAKKIGEEAGTKLMIPLFLMLIIVFAMVIVPSFFSIQM